MAIATTAAGPLPARKTFPVVIGPLVAAAILAYGFSTAGIDLGIFWGIGLALGVILQRSRFCFAGSFRDLFMARDGRLMRSLIAGMLIATPGFWLLMTRLVPDPSLPGLPHGAHVLPVGLNLVVGGLLFGVGMVIAGGCVSGTLFRIGEGYTASLVTLGGILGGLSLAAHTWNWWWQNSIKFAPIIWLPNILGHGGALILTMAALGALYVLVLWWEMRDPGMPSMPGKPEMPPMSFGEAIQRFNRKVFHQGWPYVVGGIALGGLNTFSFVYDHPIGVTGELSAWAERITGLVGMAAGPLIGTDQFAGCNLAVGDGSWISSSLTLDAGLIFGSFIAALASSEFKLRFPRKKLRYAQSIAGGVAMGYGSGIAVGCTLGAFFSSIPSLSVSAWVFGPSLALGAYLGTILIKRLP